MTTRRWNVRGVAAGVLLAGALSFSAGAQRGTTGGEWPYYAGDAGSTKYSPLDQITAANVKNLQIAWRWKSDNFGPKPDPYLQSTPLAVKGVLYTTAGTRRDVVAIDGKSGETLWMFRADEGERGDQSPIRAPSGRGLAYWTDGKEERILHVTLGYRLVALNAKTGQLIASFGRNGYVDLKEGMSGPVPPDGFVGYNSPGLVIGDLVVIGAAFSTKSVDTPAQGSVRAFDVRTGRRRWIFHTIPRRDDPATQTWEDGSLEYASNAGVWAPMSADLELGYIYVPTETASVDVYGGHRHGDNLYADTLVCLNAKTGEKVWYYQFVHHGLWDWDIPVQPILLDVTVGGRKVKAVAQITKQAWLYVFDRVTGKPIWPIEERPVPPSDVPTEKASATQPFPTKPAAFDRQGVTLDDIFDVTPEVKAEALKVLKQFRYGPIFTPPSVSDPDGTRGTIGLPNLTGGGNWQGGAADPETGIVYVASATYPGVFAVRPCETPKTNVPAMKYCMGGGGASTTIAGGLPIVKPPWGRITAIDLNTGDHVWMVPNGDTPDIIKNHPLLKGVTLPRTGKPDRSGLFVTKTLLFAGEGSGLFAAGPGGGGPVFRAYDKRTGQIVWEFTLPANQSGVPMSYMADGKQYIAVPVGAPNHPGEIVALRLP